MLYYINIKSNYITNIITEEQGASPVLFLCLKTLKEENNMKKFIIRILRIVFTSIVFSLNFIMEAYASEIVDTSNHLYTYAEMIADASELTVAYPDKISYRSIGTSCDGRSIIEIIVGNPLATKSVYVQAGVHGREWMNCMLVMKQIEYSISNLPDGFTNCNIHVVPMVNPDGVTISQFGFMGIQNEMLRTSAMMMPGATVPSKWKANARGVDINRNFSTGWGYKIDCLVPSSENYNGGSAMSEPESMAVVNSFNQTSYSAAVSYHSFEGAIYWDIGQAGDIRTRTSTLASIVQASTGYRFGVVSPLKGLDYNMMIFEKNVPAVVIETGTAPCPMPYSQWASLWKRNKDVLINLAMTYQ